MSLNQEILKYQEMIGTNTISLIVKSVNKYFLFICYLIHASYLLKTYYFLEILKIMRVLYLTGIDVWYIQTCMLNNSPVVKQLIFLKKAPLVLLINLIPNRYGQLFSEGVIKQFVPNAPFLYPLKTSEKAALVTNGLRFF